MFGPKNIDSSAITTKFKPMVTSTWSSSLPGVQAP